MTLQLHHLSLIIYSLLLNNRLAVFFSSKKIHISFKKIHKNKILY